MVIRRALSFAALALCLSFGRPQVAAADPTESAAAPAEGRDDEPRGQLREAQAALRLKDYDAAVAKYTKFIDDFGLEKSCRA